VSGGFASRIARTFWLSTYIYAFMMKDISAGNQ